MITAMMWLVLLLVVVGLILTIYGDANNELFCFYVGIGMGMIAALVLILILLTI
jgi:hypothetical protein